MTLDNNSGVPVDLSSVFTVVMTLLALGRQPFNGSPGSRGRFDRLINMSYINDGSILTD